ncbi:hypothetical protein [Pseudalkalibacillus decolorationis]|uniref:hypothetical protein n=1 Tax=Pseudalkalibacillus decolorationis TaxID=163879 RepID=UPI002148CA13|nr:hypothetical protein [Pseudalkalibacillus decolorationis]
MKRNYTVAFLMLFVSSIAGGLALKDILDYSMMFGVSLAVVSLLCAAFFAGKQSQKEDSKN